MDVHIPPIVSYVMAMLLSITIGFAMPDRGWHNGLLVVVIFAVVALTTYEMRAFGGMAAVSKLLPMFLNTVVIAVVSALCSYAGIFLGHGNTDATFLVYYIAAVLAFGFLSTCVSVHNAVAVSKDSSAGTVLFSLVIYVISFAFGLIAVADTSANQMLVTIGFIVFCAVLSFVIMARTSHLVYN